MAENMTSAERKELEALRADKALRERAEQGIHVGEVNCSTPGCDFERQPAELRKEEVERLNADLGIVETSFTRWVPLERELCPVCEYPLTVIEPDAQSVFPRNYRWVYPKPVE